MPTIIPSKLVAGWSSNPFDTINSNVPKRLMMIGKPPLWKTDEESLISV